LLAAAPANMNQSHTREEYMDLEAIDRFVTAYLNDLSGHIPALDSIMVGFVTLLTDGVRTPVCAACQAGIPAASRHSVMASPRKCRWVLALVRCRQWLNRL
jgi:hypothetical protein